MGIRALKRLFNLPTTTPSAAIIYSFGTLYMTQELDKRRFIYLHKILNREATHWTKKMFLHLDSLNLGWVKNIKEKLAQYQLHTEWEEIRVKSKGQWKKLVTDTVDKMNTSKLIQNCTTENRTRVCTKTQHIHKQLMESTPASNTCTEVTTTTTSQIAASYTRSPLDAIINSNN